MRANRYKHGTNSRNTRAKKHLGTRAWSDDVNVADVTNASRSKITLLWVRDVRGVVGFPDVHLYINTSALSTADPPQTGIDKA